MKSLKSLGGPCMGLQPLYLVPDVVFGCHGTDQLTRRTRVSPTARKVLRNSLLAKRPKDESTFAMALKEIDAFANQATASYQPSSEQVCEA